MPDTRLAKTRRSLPEGYQFGDAGHDWASERDERIVENSIEFSHLVRQNVPFKRGDTITVRIPKHWNVIEGDRFDTNSDPGDETPTRRLRRREA